MPLFRILVVEDHAHVRRFICSTLQQRPEYLIVGEAADGLEAVDLAQDLQPDLVLLDIGLPKLNGLEAARQMRRVSPDSKILFLSLESFPDIVQEGLRLGALGYVHKMRAQLDLLPAVESVLAGNRFLSGDVALGGVKGPRTGHEVQFYSGDAVFLEGVTRFISTALKAGNPAIVLATKSHSESLVQRLQGAGIDVDAAIRQGTYIFLDAADTLSRITVNGSPSLERFSQGLISLVESAAISTKTESPRVAIFGECVGLLCAEGNMDAAIMLERAGNDLTRTRNVDILCAYPLSAFHRTEDGRAYTRICAEHTAVYSL